MASSDQQKASPHVSALGPVALSLSGGGGRAAAFHLGTLSCLDGLDILQDVSIISSVSGGTFTAAKYALTLKKAPEEEDLHETFRNFFDSFYDFLVNADLIPRAMEELIGKPPKSPSPRRTVVKALADVYDQTFMEGARFETLWDGREIHLKDIIFNSTECKDGMAFRFQKTEQKHKIGNARVWIDEKHAMKIRMADIVAASSDIPIGLEPLLFPQDFVWPEESPRLWRDVQDHLKQFNIERLPLMDGGVIDNQGIDGVLIAARPPLDGARLTESTVLQYDLLMEFMNSVDPTPAGHSDDFVYEYLPGQDDLGLFFISDVPALSDDIYDPKPDVSLATLTRADRSGWYWGLHLPHGLGGWLTVSRMSVVAWIMFLISGVTAAQFLGYAIFVGPPYGGTSWGLDAFFFHAVPLVLSGTLFAALILLRSTVRSLLGETAPAVPHLWQCFRRLSLDDLIYMTYARLSSTWALTGTIFLNRIRRLMYYSVYTAESPLDVDKDLVNPHESGTRKKGLPLHSRLVLCEIYGINRTLADLKMPSWCRPTSDMKKIAEAASNTPTTLWLTEPQVQHLVTCGQITTCFSLLRHLMPRKGESHPIDDLLARTLEHWETLKKDSRYIPSQTKSTSHSRDSSRENPSSRKAKA